MADSKFDVAWPRAGELVVTLRGDFSQADAEQLEGTVKDATAARGAQGLLVRVDLNALTDMSIHARSVLVRVHKALQPIMKRCVYLADKSRFRGVALWVLHLAEDPNAKVVMNDPQAEEWLRGTGSRVQDAISRTELAVAAVGVRK